MNHYEALEVSPNASPEVLRAAYKSLIQRYHPDRNPGDALAAARSQRVVQAYQVLSDAAQRAAYDHELKRQAPLGEPAAARRAAPRETPTAATPRATRRPHWLLWPVTGLLVLALWYFWSAFDRPAVPQPKASTPASAPDATSRSGLRGESAKAEARTIANYLENIEVDLAAPAAPLPSAATGTATSTVAGSARQRLSIRTMSVVVGNFDPDKFVAFLDGNKDYIERQLLEKLRLASAEKLSRDSGERYLKQYLLDALGEITNTDRLEKYSLPGNEAAAHYGAVDILLPDSYTLEPQPAGPTAVHN